MHFRISRDLYLTLAERFEESKYYKSMQPTKCIPSKTYLATFLWFAGHEACSVRDLSDRFNLSISSISQIIDKVTLFVSSLSPEVIKWPTEERKAASATFLTTNVDFQKQLVSKIHLIFIFLNTISMYLKLTLWEVYANFSSQDLPSYCLYKQYKSYRPNLF